MFRFGCSPVGSAGLAVPNQRSHRVAETVCFDDPSQGCDVLGRVSVDEDQIGTKAWLYLSPVKKSPGPARGRGDASQGVER